MDLPEGIENSNFVSSIKVKGINLLPPVINDKRRSELLKYKQQAVKLEKRLEKCRELKKNLEELLTLQTFSDRPISAITFSDNSHIDALGLETSREASHSKRPMKLTHDIVDVSEYSNDGIKVIDSEMGTNSNEGQSVHLNSETTNSVGIEEHPVDQICPVLDLSDLTKSSSLDDSFSNISPVSERPKLIRSNSYTLEAPSPILLEHLKKYGTIDEVKPTEPSQWSFNDSYIPLEDSEFSSMNTVYNNDLNKDKDTLANTTHDIPRIEVIQTDISVQQITVNGNTETTLSSPDPNQRLFEVLRNVPEEYSKQIIELIEKQCLEQLAKAEAKKQVISESVLSSARSEELVSFNSTPVRGEQQNEHNRYTISRVSMSPSQSIDYSVTGSGTLMPTTPCSGLLDFDCQNDAIDEQEKLCTAEELVEASKNTAYSRQNTSLDKIEQEWAASVIGAHVRGYLTRRLLKTERVQTLIETIKDALLCAIQLHNAENIDESDVELHRRLMNQVSAACFAFHDVFFTLTVAEQMSLIAADRQRKIDKSKRPISAPTPRRSRSNSSRSSTRSATSMSRSLTKV